MPLTVGANHFPSSPAPISFPSISISNSSIPSQVVLQLKHSTPFNNPFYQRFLKYFPEFQMQNSGNLTGNYNKKLSLFDVIACHKTNNNNNPKYKSTDQTNSKSSFNNKPNNLIHLIILLILLQLIPFVLVYCIEECSPLVLFSWWRNKIS